MYTPAVYFQKNGSLTAYHPALTTKDEWRERVQIEIKKLLGQPDYPCVAAIQGLNKDEFRVGIYSQLGTGIQAKSLVQDLLAFQKEQLQSGALFLTFWAIFPEGKFEDETSFESALWRELTYLVKNDSPGTPWDPHFSSDPAQTKFCFSIGGHAYFVVGLHPRSSRLARQFPLPVLIFNLYQQFEELDRRGQFYPMVKIIRKREIKFQGQINPMVKKHGDKWEAIQFSGKNNPDDWKCPFGKTHE